MKLEEWINGEKPLASNCTHSTALFATGHPTPTTPDPETDRRYGWMRGFTYQDLCQRLAEGHHDE